MIAVHLYDNERVTQVLRENGCEFVERVDERTDGYKTSWGHFFTVPAISEMRGCPKMVLYEIIAELERLKGKLN